jgi:hypothetical protein
MYIMVWALRLSARDTTTEVATDDGQKIYLVWSWLPVIKFNKQGHKIGCQPDNEKRPYLQLHYTI